MSNITRLKTATPMPVGGTSVARSSNLWRAATLISNFLGLVLAAAMLLLALRADQVFDRQESFAIAIANSISNIALMTGKLVELQELAMELQKSSKAEDKQRSISIEQEMVRLRAEIQAASQQLAVVLRSRVRQGHRAPLPSEHLKSESSPGCFNKDLAPVFPCPPN